MYTEIFDDIVSITHNDYSGHLDKKGWDDPEKYRSQIKKMENEDVLDPGIFQEIVEDYLLDFKDRHIYFRLKDNEKHNTYHNGFSARRFDDKLHVTEVTDDDRLEAGDVLLSLDGIPINVLIGKHARELFETVAERENWRPIIQRYARCEIEGSNGTTRILELKQFARQDQKPQFKVDWLKEDVLFMTLPSFGDVKAVEALLEQYEEELNTAEKLIIDVRENGGGSDLAFRNLLPYLFPEGETSITLEDSIQEFNCTRRNAELTAKAFGQFLENIDDESVKKNLYKYVEDMKKNVGKGFKILEGEPPVINIQGKAFPKEVVVLSDVHCASASEVLIEFCKESSKATVMGRATAGVNDYSNLVIEEWEDLFELWYPTSRMAGMNKRTAGDAVSAIHPDIHTPWTPEHTSGDIDLEKALEFLEG
ncbi:S41 family peptidase [Salinicoccus bachuensis]|uniref:S41 family peptidase n=1 Tax=Salinicoccus bachuensis TaxID=3136731 RepID=A0ABZ3CLY6_9STAP